MKKLIIGLFAFGTLNLGIISGFICLRIFNMIIISEGQCLAIFILAVFTAIIFIVAGALNEW